MSFPMPSERGAARVDEPREVATTRWRCAECGALHALIMRRRHAGACANCGRATLRPAFTLWPPDAAETG
jgi:hypothetical protein